MKVIPLVISVLMLAGTSLGAQEKYESYYANGQLRETGFKNDKGQKVGEWITYRHTGKKLTKEHYQDGKPHGEKITYRSNGKVASKESFKDGKLHGECVWYWPNGKVLRRAVYKDGEMVSEEYE